jgi:hypothetical protein
MAHCQSEFRLLWTEQADNQIGDRIFPAPDGPMMAVTNLPGRSATHLKHRYFSIAETDIVQANRVLKAGRGAFRIRSWARLAFNDGP